MIRVERLNDFAQLQREDWEGAAKRSGASIFYAWDVIAAYAQTPLLPMTQAFYFIARDADGAARAVVPAYLSDDCDPFGLLDQHVPDFDTTRRRGLLTHYWHCYDSGILGDVGHAEIAEALVTAFEQTAVEFGAATYGFINVPVSNKTFHALQATRLISHPLWDRFQLPLESLDTFEKYLFSLEPVFRRELQRHLRRMADAGAVCRVESPPFTHLDRVVQMCHETAARHGTGFYYPPARLKAFLLRCGAAVRFVCIWFGDDLLGVFVCFADAHRLHLWAAGTRYDLARFSPYLIAFAESVRYAIANGFTLVEGGRGNGAKKRKLGFQPLPLHVLIRQLP